MSMKALPLRYFKEINNWDTVIFIYNAALKEIGTKIDILNDEFQHRHRYNLLNM